MKRIVAILTVLTIMIASTLSISANAASQEDNNKNISQEHYDSFCRYLITVFPWFSTEDLSGLESFFIKVCEYNEYTVYRYSEPTGDYDATFRIGPLRIHTFSGYTDYYKEDHEGTGIYLVNDKEVLSLSQAYETGKIYLPNADELLNKMNERLRYVCEYCTDLDKNNRLDIKDVTLLQEYIASDAGNDFDINYDFNHDRTVNINDATDLQRCIAGYIIWS